MVTHPGLMVALRVLWSAPYLDCGPYSAYVVLAVAGLTREMRAVTLSAAPWFAEAVAEFVQGGRRAALVDRVGLPTAAGRAAGIPWPPSSPRSDGSW